MATPEESRVQLRPGDLVCYDVDGEESVGVYTGSFDPIGASSPLAKALPKEIVLGESISFKTGSGPREQTHRVTIKAVSRDLSRLTCLPDSLAA